MLTDFLDEESLTNILKPIYPSKKEDWVKACYVRFSPYSINRFKSEELLKAYVFADIESYVREHSFYPLVGTKEYHANFLRISMEEYEKALNSLIEEEAIAYKELDDDFVVLYPVYK